MCSSRFTCLELGHNPWDCKVTKTPNSYYPTKVSDGVRSGGESEGEVKAQKSNERKGIGISEEGKYK